MNPYISSVFHHMAHDLLPYFIYVLLPQKLSSISPNSAFLPFFIPLSSVFGCPAYFSCLATDLSVFYLPKRLIHILHIHSAQKDYFTAIYEFASLSLSIYMYINIYIYTHIHTYLYVLCMCLRDIRGILDLFRYPIY